MTTCANSGLRCCVAQGRSSGGNQTVEGNRAEEQLGAKGALSTKRSLMLPGTHLFPGGTRSTGRSTWSPTRGLESGLESGECFLINH